MTPLLRGPLPARKRCAGRCARVLPLELYNFDNQAGDGRQSYCPECKASSTREAYLLKTYGITPRLAQECMAIQGNRCPLCGNSLDFGTQPKPMRKWTCVPDHNHDTTGEVYGFVHSVCNTRNTGRPSRERGSPCLSPRPAHAPRQRGRATDRPHKRARYPATAAAVRGLQRQRKGTIVSGPAIGQPHLFEPPPPITLTLRDKFLVPPFSVLDARAGYWQDRKRSWLNLGIKGELGRDASLLYESKELTAPSLNYYRDKNKAEAGRELALLAEEETGDAAGGIDSAQGRSGHLLHKGNVRESMSGQLERLQR